MKKLSLAVLAASIAFASHAFAAEAVGTNRIINEFPEGSIFARRRLAELAEIL